MRPFSMAAPNLKKYVGPFQFCCSSLYFYILTKFRLTSCVAMDKTNVSGLETFIPTEKKRSLRPGNARLQKYWTCEWRSHALPPTFTPMTLHAYCPALARRSSHFSQDHFVMRQIYRLGVLLCKRSIAVYVHRTLIDCWKFTSMFYTFWLINRVSCNAASS